MKKLIKEVVVGANEQSYPIIHVVCNAKALSVVASAIDKNKAEFLIQSEYENFDCEWVSIDFKSNGDDFLTYVAHTDKYDISIIIVPYSFVYLAENESE